MDVYQEVLGPGSAGKPASQSASARTNTTAGVA
jgi:hypothetical protein